jgi:LAO/AO transport system kinase
MRWSDGRPSLGVTGAPGAGKSTLLDALVRTLRPRGETLAIVAVDPSSRETGGALLGDRVRVRSGAADPGVLIRSMAARDRLGGLADGTRAAVVILAAAFDRVFVETVGVGQSEIEVAALVDTLVYVVNPGTGDFLQFMKAGILEVPDIIVVNKADFGAEAARTAGDLESGLSLGERQRGEGPPPVLLVSARDGTGIDALAEALDAHRRYGSFGVESIGGPPALRARIREDDTATAFALITRLGREIEDALRKPI